MGANALGRRNLARLTAMTGVPIAHAVVWSHVESGRYCRFRTADNRWGQWDRFTGSWEWDFPKWIFDTTSQEFRLVLHDGHIRMRVPREQVGRAHGFLADEGLPPIPGRLLL